MRILTLVFSCLIVGTGWALTPKLDVNLELPQQPSVIDVDAEGRRALLGLGLAKSTGSIRIVERQTGKMLWAVSTRGVRECRFCDKGKLLFVSTPDGWSMWDTVSFKPVAQVKVANTAAGAKDDGSLVVVCQGTTVKAYDGHGKLWDTFVAGSAQYDHLMVSADGIHFALYGAEGFYLYDMPARNNFGENNGHVAFHPDGKSLVRQSPTGWMVDLAMDTGSGLTKPVQTHTSGEVEFSPHGEFILSQGKDEEGKWLTQVWKFPGLEPVSSRPLGVGGHSVFSGDGKNVISWELDGQTVVWNAATGAVEAGPLHLPGNLHKVTGGAHWLLGIGGTPSKGYYCSYTW